MINEFPSLQCLHRLFAALEGELHVSISSNDALESSLLFCLLSPFSEHADVYILEVLLVILPSSLSSSSVANVSNFSLCI